MNPNSFDVGALTGMNPLTVVLALLGSLVLSLSISLVYKGTHRGLSYSQSFQFSLVLLGVLGSVVMMVASGSLLRAIGILGAFSLIRFRTAIKDPKDMAYILLVLSVGLAMGAEMYFLAVTTTILLCIVILILTRINFGMTKGHDAVIRLLCKEEKGSTVSSASYEALLAKLADSFHLLSAHARGDRMEYTYGVRPRRDSTTLAILDALRKEKGVEDAEFFDTKHQVEF